MTLVEIMVALVIFLIMMSMLLPIYVRSMDARSRSEELAQLHATARGAFDLLRRDLQGAFRMAAETYDFGNAFHAGEEFHWEAPVDAADPAKGFGRLTFVTAMDGTRRGGDPLEPYEYDLTSWAVRGGALFRQVGNWNLVLVAASKPPGWQEVGSDPGVSAGQEVYSDAATQFSEVGAYRGTPYIQTSTSSDPPPTVLQFESGGSPTPVTFIAGFEQGRPSLPGWATDFRKTPDTIKTPTVTYELFSTACPDGRVSVGSNEGGAVMYFVIVEPLWWSLGEEAEGMVFRFPVGYAIGPPDGDGIRKGSVPEWVEVELTLAGPGHPLGVRRFAQRIAIPAGEGP
jgi:type II secretory pathway pseudopilin PulG